MNHPLSINHAMTSADAFNQDLNGWDVGSVTDMQRSFQSAGRFNGLVADWEVSVVTDPFPISRKRGMKDHDGKELPKVLNAHMVFEK